VTLSAAEKAALAAEADRSGMAVAAWLGRVGLDAAQHRAVPVPQMQREMLTALIDAADLVSRIETGLNRAMARLNAAEGPGPDLEPAARYCLRVIRHLDEAAELVRQRLR
jgi:hypothetical protein